MQAGSATKTGCEWVQVSADRDVGFVKVKKFLDHFKMHQTLSQETIER